MFQHMNKQAGFLCVHTIQIGFCIVYKYKISVISILVQYLSRPNLSYIVQACLGTSM